MRQEMIEIDTEIDKEIFRAIYICMSFVKFWVIVRKMFY